MRCCSKVLIKAVSGYGLSQWETTLHCNVVSHWQSPFPDWCLGTLSVVVMQCGCGVPMRFWSIMSKFHKFAHCFDLDLWPPQPSVGGSNQHYLQFRFRFIDALHLPDLNRKCHWAQISTRMSGMGQFGVIWPKIGVLVTLTFYQSSP